jgi:hypothetical protein
MEIKMNKFPSTMRLIPIIAAVTVGLFSSMASAQQNKEVPWRAGDAPGVPQDGYGKPLPVDPAEVRRDNTAGPGEAPGVPQDGYGKSLSVSRGELRRDDTANPGSLPSAMR